jgi:O-6-methylguanine DNA methyltransferase
LNEKNACTFTGRFHDFGIAMAPMNRKRLALARQRLGLRRPSTAFATPHPSKAPAAIAPERRFGAPRRRKGWRSPKPGGNPDGSWMEMSMATKAGPFLARYSEKGLAELHFPVRRAPSFHRRRRGDESQISSAASASVRDSSRPPSAVLLRRTGRLLQAKIRGWHRATASALKAVLAGHSPKKFPPLDLVGTEFQKSVWNALRKISLGKTKSYGEIARTIGKPKAVRAVGGACGANPVPVLVPCHRVLAADKKLGGFSGGLNWKRELLAREGVCLQPQSGDR